jgi:NADPH:quinone reductase-like Zn-dependent oxidoreductase
LGADHTACTSSAAKGERLKALGTDRVINTSEQDFVAATFERYGKTSFSIVASGAAELSGCDSSAEVATRRTEGQTKILIC